MTFIDDNGQILEVDGDFALSKRAVSVFNFELKGDVSINFRVPNTSETRETLGYFGANMLNPVAATRKRFNASKDGNTWARGYIYIVDEYIDYLECYFSSGNGNWFNLLQGNISEYSYDDYIKLYTDISSSTEGICFPIVDWAFSGNRRSTEFIQSALCQGSVNIQPGNMQEFFPCMYLYSIVDEIQKNTGVKFGGDILTDQNYKSIVITPRGPALQYPDKAIADTMSFVKLSADEAHTSSLEIIAFDSVITEGGINYDVSTSRYTAYRTATYKVSIDFVVSETDSYNVQLWVNGVFSKTIYNLVVFAPSAVDMSIITFDYLNLTKGDYVEVYISQTSGAYDLLAVSSVKFEINKDIRAFIVDGANRNTVSYVNPSAIVPDIKAIDLIKFITFYFGCVCTFDEYTNTVNINRIDGITDSEDWSDYFVSYRNNYNKSVGTNNYIKTAPPSEDNLIYYNNKNKTNYGGGNIETDFTNTIERTMYQTPFAPAEDIPNNTFLNWFMPFIKFYDLTPDNTKSSLYTVVADNGSGFCRFTSANTFVPGDVVEIADENKIYSGYGIVSVATTTYFDLYGFVFLEDSTGQVIKINYTEVNGSNRILYVLPAYDVENANGPASWTYRYGVSLASSSSSGTADVAFFDKPKINNVLDNFRQSLAISNIPGKEFNNTIGDQYQSKFKTIMNNPAIVATMKLPESKFVSFNFRKKIYLNTERLTGSFFVESINDYVDSNTDVNIPLYML